MFMTSSALLASLDDSYTDSSGRRMDATVAASSRCLQ